jgi:hypothetical protein
VLRAAVARRAVAVVESAVHERESAPRPDLGLLELLHELSGGRRLPEREDDAVRDARRRLAATIARELPERRAQAGDAADLEALALALRHCDLVACDAFMADVVRRTRLHLRHRVEVYSGRRADVLALRDVVAAAPPARLGPRDVAAQPRVPGRRRGAPRRRLLTGEAGGIAGRVGALERVIVVHAPGPTPSGP